MGNKHDIQHEILSAKGGAQDTIRRKYLKELAKYTKNDVIVYSSAFASAKKGSNISGEALSISNEDIQGFMSALHGLDNTKLDLILHSPGGSLEAADQIVQYLRSKYETIRVIIPQNAMSAATMIACAADEIVMGKHSAIGPIDPQMSFPANNGRFTAPAQSILDEFEQAKQEIAKDPSTIPLWVNKINSYPQGFLNICQNTIILSKERVAQWLDKYMFKGGCPDKCKEIAEWLGNAKEHKTHGRPIGVKMVKELGLNVSSLEEDQDLQEKVLSVYHACMTTHEVTNCMKFIENHQGKGHFLNAEIHPQPIMLK